jgi:hypothetical protein
MYVLRGLSCELIVPFMLRRYVKKAYLRRRLAKT